MDSYETVENNNRTVCCLDIISDCLLAYLCILLIILACFIGFMILDVLKSLFFI